MSWRRHRIKHLHQMVCCRANKLYFLSTATSTMYRILRATVIEIAWSVEMVVETRVRTYAEKFELKPFCVYYWPLLVVELTTNAPFVDMIYSIEHNVCSTTRVESLFTITLTTESICSSYCSPSLRNDENKSGTVLLAKLHSCVSA